MNWTHKAKKAVTLTLAAGMMLTTPAMSLSAAPRAGVSGMLSASERQGDKPFTVERASTTRSGVSLLISGNVKNSTASLANKKIDVSASSEVTDALGTSDIKKIGIAKVNLYTYIRTQPSTESDYAGKLYPNGAAVVTGESGEWYQVKSGDVTGYILKEHLSVGNKDEIKAVAKKVATVVPESINVRREANDNSEVICLGVKGTDLSILDDSKKDSGWIKVSINDFQGYVKTSEVNTVTKFSLAESKSSEMARLAEEAAQQKAAREAQLQQQMAERQKALRRMANNAGGKRGNRVASRGRGRSGYVAQERTYEAPGSASGNSVLAFASQFVGNPYVYGGTSLTNGTDCSGFVMGVYKNFGVGLPHSSAAMRNVGYGVSQSQMKAGDIVCYSGHVGIYDGNGRIVNAATGKLGITYLNAHYSKILAVRRVFD